MEVVFSERAYASILTETTEKIRTETGGLFLGALMEDVWYVIEAIDPGPNSIFEVAYFEYDQKYTQHLINKTANLYEGKLELLGLWHRHPGSFDRFSSTDNGTNAKYAAMRKSGAISALVNIDPTFRLTVYHVGQPYKYTQIPCEVGDHLIPKSLLAFKSQERFHAIMQDILGAPAKGKSNANATHHANALSLFMQHILPALEDVLCDSVKSADLIFDDATQEQIIDEIIEDISFLADEFNIEALLCCENNCLVLSQKNDVVPLKLYFIFSTSQNAVVLCMQDRAYLYQSGLLKRAFEKAKPATDKARAQSAKLSNRKLDSLLKAMRATRNGDGV